jgi:hypothetical protein
MRNKRGYEEMSQTELLNQINRLRKRMIEMGSDKGLDDSETIMISQELDHLLFDYQLIILGKRP